MREEDAVQPEDAAARKASTSLYPNLQAYLRLSQALKRHDSYQYGYGGNKLLCEVSP